MIVVQILGGLGNQMFQYALGRNLALKTGQTLRFDLSRPNPSHLGRFDLDLMRIQGRVISKVESTLVWRTLDRYVEPAIARLGLSRRTRSLHRVYRQPSLRFDPDVLKLRGWVYLSGYWQCERYFADIRDVLREDLSVKAPPNPANAAALEAIQACQSVCVHVRRQDYVNNARTNSVHGACDLPYYESARRLIEERTGGAHYFIFSDDPTWAGANLSHWGNVTIISHNSVEDRHDDFRLMTACKHFITANSSFSWWPAWLSSAPGKVVVAPRRWFADPAFDGEDVVPRGWLRA
jgi:hypothetical protein